MHAQRLNTILKRIRDIGPIDNSRGICGNIHLYNEVDDQYPYTLIVSLFKNWPEFSGDFNYPVPDPEKNIFKRELPCIAFSKFAFWDNSPYAQARKRLLDFMIKETEQ